MTTKIKSRKTPEQRKAEADALQASIAAQVEQLRDSDQWKAFLTFAGSFHSYSLNNLMLIQAQNPNATAVAGFRQWQAKGRQVRKGERSIKIRGFRQKKVAADAEAGADEQEGTDEQGQKTITYFPVLSVFDVSQTDPIDPDAAEPHEIVQRLRGEDQRGIVDAVASWLKSQGWSFERASIPGETNGYTTVDGTKRVVVDENLSPAQAAKTALHEAAHVILHSHEDYATYVAHRGIKETEAESVAYVLAGLLGLDTAVYSIGYVAGWAGGDVEMIHATAANVLRAVHQLAEALIEDEDQSAAAA